MSHKSFIQRARRQRMANPQPRQERALFHRALRATPDAVRDTLVDLRVRFVPLVNEDALARMELVLAEVMNNVAEHGIAEAPERPAPVIHLCVMQQSTGLACTVSDDGESLPQNCLVPQGLPDDDDEGLPEGGFGWFIIHDLTQSLCYFREGSRNFLAFTVPGEPEAMAE